VTAGDQLRCAIVLVKVIQVPDGTDAVTKRRVPIGAAIVVAVERLRRFTRVAVDRKIGRQQEIRLQHRFKDRQNRRVFNDDGKIGMFCQQRIDPLGVEALKVIAAHVFTLKVGGQCLAESRDFGFSQEALDDGVTILANSIDVLQY